MASDPIHDAPKLQSYPAAKENALALDRSRINMLNATNLNRQAMGILWNEAIKSPMFQQRRAQPVCKDTGAKLGYPRHHLSGKELKWRANRALTGNTLKTMASGAAATIGAQLAVDCAMLRTGHVKGPEDPKYPLLPSFSGGAALAIEAAYIAYMQELFHTAQILRNGHGKHKKVTAKGCQLAAEIVNRQIAAATSFVPPSGIAYRKPDKTIKKKKNAAASDKAASLPTKQKAA
jgi:hypothetical protein